MTNAKEIDESVRPGFPVERLVGQALTCPVCGGIGEWQFTKGKGKRYVACDAHRIKAILLGAKKT